MSVIYRSTSSQNKKKIEAQDTALKDYVKCEISSINKKTESTIKNVQ